ncbi:Transposase protein [Popillia japonica]|uniref:Transposase protein n=1 Tax=Popillia japonica TaxID=7064 RepID=A0AAW1MZ17_POPJA
MDRYSCLMFDEISLSPGFAYDSKLKKVVGYVDLGVNGRRSAANHALVFMLSGLHKAWKQPIAYYFTKDQIPTAELKKIIVEIITQLQSISVRIVCCVCDQGSTNSAALRQLVAECNSDKPGPYFTVNDKVTVSVHDPPYLLKNIRNALMKYDIEFEDKKTAKWQHIVACFEFDSQRIFQCLPKLTKEDLMLQKSYMKMRVCVAARTLSYTMAAAIETFSVSTFSSDALHTAQFVEQVDKLFDSVNGRTPYPEKGKDMRACVSRTSKHRDFWYSMLKKFECGTFVIEMERKLLLQAAEWVGFKV